MLVCLWLSLSLLSLWGRLLYYYGMPFNTIHETCCWFYVSWHVNTPAVVTSAKKQSNTSTPCWLIASYLYTSQVTSIDWSTLWWMDQQQEELLDYCTNMGSCAVVHLWEERSIDYSMWKPCPPLRCQTLVYKLTPSAIIRRPGGGLKVTCRKGLFIIIGFVHGFQLFASANEIPL